MSNNKTVILGVSGSIAAYKAADIINSLTKSDITVNPVMTKGAAEFITPLLLQTLSKNKVYIDVFQEDCPSEVKHISLAQKADLLLIAPASADIIGKLANGIADDMLTSIYLAVRKIPVLIAPAMNTRMYEHPAVQENLSKLRNRGVYIIEPKESVLACGDVGKGALADVDQIVSVVLTHLNLKNI